MEKWKCPQCGREFRRTEQPHYCGKPTTEDEDVGLYPGGEATTVFAEALSGLDVSKGSIRLPYDRELPRELNQKNARWCGSNYAR